MNNSDTSASSSGQRRSMTEMEEKERRASIQAIMRDPKLTPQERRRSIQNLMDGRRRSSTAGQQPNNSNNNNNNAISNGDRGSLAGMGMAAAAAMAAAEFVDSSSDDEEEMQDEVNMNRNKVANGSAAKKRSSFIFKRGSSHNVAGGSGEKSGKRRTSLRASFTQGFSRMGVRASSSNIDSSNADAASASLSAIMPPVFADPNSLSRKLEKGRPPCGHYERNCSIVSPCCGLVFGCRICHNDQETLPPPFLLQGGGPPSAAAAHLAAAGMVPPGDAMSSAFAAASMPYASAPGSPGAAKKPAPVFSHRSASLPTDFTEEESHHEIDRFLIKEIICRECYTRQSSKTNNCINCGILFGTYHCSTCNLWMSADEDPYHCLKCGFCRVGGRENFTHCDDCGMCIDALLFEDHNCKSGKYMSNCPVCQEDLFSSRMASHEMPCGHAIHWHCFRELTSHDTRCPVCKKTAETHDQMEQTWNAMAMGIALQPVPADMTRVVDILCNDCEGKSLNQRWHFLGVQCRRCTSFNTTVERTVMVGQEAADFLGPMTDIAAQAQWAAGSADQSVLAALMGGGTAAAAAGMANGENMDTEALNQSVAAEVMGIMNRSNPPFAGSMDEDDDREEAYDRFHSMDQS